MITADKATLSLFKYKSTEVEYWFCLEETEKNNSEYFHNGSKIDNYNWLQNRPNVGLNCLKIEYSKWVVKVTFNAHFQQAENE